MEKRHEKLVVQLAIIFVIFFVLMIGVKVYLSGFAIYDYQPDSSASKDTYIKQNFNNTNYNSGTRILVGKDSSGNDLRGLIELNVSNLTSNTILSAKLQINVSYASANDNITITAYRVTTNWAAGETTWSNATSSTMWTTIGGDYGEAVDSITVSNISQLYNLTITTAVRGWVNGTYTNYGLILISSDAATGNRREIESSETTESASRPKIIVDYTENAAPTIVNASTNSSLTNPKKIGQSVTFNVSWNDLEGDNAQLYVCNSSSITTAGCGDTTFCSTSLASTNPVQCSYTTVTSNNRSTLFYFAMCDSTNCSTTNQSYFYVNHAPTILVVQPNGSETMNQSQGNYSIKFNVSDADNDHLFGQIYYGATQNSTTNTIASDLNLTKYCTDADSLTSTTNNCTYSFNSSGIYGTYFLTIIVNDTFVSRNDSSDNSFNIRSIEDSFPPAISSQWIESNITSGKAIQIYANVTDDNTISSVWAAINTTPQVNVTLLNESATTYNGTWIAVDNGTYQYKVYAIDVLGNVNNSMPWTEFNISTPNATAQNAYSASTVLPYHTIKVTGELNATHPLRTVYAYLNTPNGFTFLSSYPQNYLMGNFTADEIKNATWFLSVPITETTYVLNITFTDYYSNTWSSSNMNVVVTSAVGGGYELDASGYPSVAAGDNYYSEAYFKASGISTSADSVRISLYDPLGNLIVGPVSMDTKSTGVYNYTYSVPASQTTGQWETIINATKNSVDYFAHHFWKLVGALFDVRDITIINSTVDGLNISVVAENVGTTTVDLTLAWNLTRVDTNELLDSGGETFAVGATPVTRYYHPSTTYVGQVKIVFLGRYSGTETAGAYEIFSTTSGTTTPPVTPPSTGGGGGGGGTTTVTEKVPNIQLAIDSIINIQQDVAKKIPLMVTNNGEKELTNLSLSIEGLDATQYSISPPTISSLGIGQTSSFEIEFLILETFDDKNVIFTVKSNELSKAVTSKISVLSILDFLRKEIDRLTNKITETRNNLTNEGLKTELQDCESIIEDIKNKMNNSEYISAKDRVADADSCIDKIVEKSQKKGIFTSIINWFKGFKFPEIKFPEIKIESWIVITIVVFIFILLMIILIALKIHSRHKLLKFINVKKPETKAPEQPKTVDSKYFEDRVKKIQERLKD